MARSRCLDNTGEYSVWQIPENGVCTSPCQHGTGFFFCATFWTGRFLMGKTINDRFANKELRPSGICLGATWAGIFCYTEIADLWRLGFIYTEFADAWRLDFIYTEIADTLVVEGLARRRHCFCFIPDASKISSSFSCRFFLS